MRSFKYSIIKYMPDPKRGEIINVGLVVFKADSLDVRVINSAAKLRMLDGSSNIEDIENLKDSIEQISELSGSVDRSLSILKSFRSPSYLSETAEFIIDDDNQYEQRVRNLFNLLIKPHSAKDKVTRTPRILSHLKDKFESMDLLAKSTDDLSRHKMVYNYPLNEKSGFNADFILKNGKYHITEAIDFNVNDLNSKFKETSMCKINCSGGCYECSPEDHEEKCTECLQYGRVNHRGVCEFCEDPYGQSALMELVELEEAILRGQE